MFGEALRRARGCVARAFAVRRPENKARKIEIGASDLPKMRRTNNDSKGFNARFMASSYNGNCRNEVAAARESINRTCFRCDPEPNKI
jgi:hypothetical protein